MLILPVFKTDGNFTVVLVMCSLCQSMPDWARGHLFAKHLIRKWV